MNTILAQLKQPSTFRGLAVLGGLLGLHLSPEHWDSIATAVGAVLGLVEVFRKEK
jgi:hypothetical protein